MYVPVLNYGSETMIWLYRWTTLLGIRRMDRFLNPRIRELYGVKKGVDERIDAGVLRWFGHVERMEMPKEYM